ncbi:MAG TPA: PQQ-binding-like beta-propeller repeat protein, partial [Stellaceae bacterium]|nr:PQQ-binding-like beta-propeller repeat protein [Stellaceae bacterium]
GKVLWKTHTGGAIDSSPAVVNGVVYVGSNDFSVYAIDAISVPEPPSLALLAFGLVWVGLLLTRRRKGAPKNSHDPLHAAVERLTGPSSLLVQLIKP